MALVRRKLDRPPSAVWSVLADGRSYSGWVVGARRIRAVDDTWPDTGAHLHHALGTGAAEVKDSTKVIASEPEHRLVLEAHMGPMGTAEVEVVLEPHGSGTMVTMVEHPTGGPMRLIPAILRDPGLCLRNRLSLVRLERLARRRAAAGAPVGDGA